MNNTSSFSLLILFLSYTCIKSDFQIIKHIKVSKKACYSYGLYILVLNTHSHSVKKKMPPLVLIVETGEYHRLLLGPYNTCIFITSDIKKD